MDSNSSLGWPQVLKYNRTHKHLYLEGNISYMDSYLHQPSVATVFILSFLLLFLLCTAGKGLLCFLSLQSKHMWTVTNLFLLNLLPVTCWWHLLHGHHPPGQHHCRHRLTLPSTISIVTATWVLAWPPHVPGQEQHSLEGQTQDHPSAPGGDSALHPVLAPLWALMLLSHYANLPALQLQLIHTYIYPLAHWCPSTAASTPSSTGSATKTSPRASRSSSNSSSAPDRSVPSQATAMTPCQLPQDQGSLTPKEEGKPVRKGNWVNNQQDLILEDLEEPWDEVKGALK
ncbi:hypothetical protein WISP_01938 [Willisornis vidua]|uniref:Uncharacterized protein n=1 Tax=Willisornis vidua TaxID=1566151 RepID=A0ABQ9DYL3_9PASS|nr:hypothetical protein WISP_01938 [Willisornis vidua]